jgi:hypothetical protein
MVIAPEAWRSRVSGLGPSSGAIRRSDFDITNSVKVSDTNSVMQAVGQLVSSTWPDYDTGALKRAFRDFDDMFAGRAPGYAGVDTVYHDRQHTLDVTLTMARLLAGHDRQADALWQFGGERAVAGIIMALFHDVGYLRRDTDSQQMNGAEFTRTHVSRGIEFLNGYLPQLGLPQWAPIAAIVLHFTGYEKPFAELNPEDARDLRLGHLLGTADMITQLADRCYLEKCRDRLYPEFVLGGVALPQTGSGYTTVKYASGLDLLRQTPQFVNDTRLHRLDGEFNRAYRFLDILFDGRNPYIEAIDRNMTYLEQVLRSESWRMLRRNPPLYAASPDTLTMVRSQMLGYIKKAWLRD